MPWHASIHPELPVIETFYSGVITQSELTEAVMENISLVNEHGIFRLLGDCTALEGGHSIFDLYYLVDTVISAGIPGNLKEAVILPSLQASAEKVKFWETACLNRGFKVRLFQDRASALDWLME